MYFTCSASAVVGGGSASQACHKSPQIRARLPRSTDARSPDWGCHDTAVTGDLKQDITIKDFDIIKSISEHT